MAKQHGSSQPEEATTAPPAGIWEAGGIFQIIGGVSSCVFTRILFGTFLSHPDLESDFGKDYSGQAVNTYEGTADIHSLVLGRGRRPNEFLGPNRTPFPAPSVRCIELPFSPVGRLARPRSDGHSGVQMNASIRSDSGVRVLDSDFERLLVSFLTFARRDPGGFAPQLRYHKVHESITAPTDSPWLSLSGRIRKHATGKSEPVNNIYQSQPAVRGQAVRAQRWPQRASSSSGPPRGPPRGRGLSQVALEVLTWLF